MKSYDYDFVNGQVKILCNIITCERKQNKELEGTLIAWDNTQKMCDKLADALEIALGYANRYDWIKNERKELDKADQALAEWRVMKG